MKQELEKIKKEFNDKIDALILKNSTPPKQEFEVGKWYKSDKALCKYNATGKDCEGWDTEGTYKESYWNFFNPKFDTDIRPATESEVKEALVKEFERKGMNKAKVGLEFIGGHKNTWAYDCEIYEYDFKTDTLYCHMAIVYQQGKWATIIDSPIMIGGYEVSKEKDSFGVYFKIGCKSIRYDDLLNLSQVMGLNGFASIRFDDHDAVSLETIKSILEKLK